MTADYARLSYTTIRCHWEKVCKVNAGGQTVTLDPGGPLTEAAWAKQRIGRATQALPNGYCQLPIQELPAGETIREARWRDGSMGMGIRVSGPSSVTQNR